MKGLIRFSLLLIILIVRSGQEPSCDVEDDQCSESESKSVMLQAVEEIAEDKELDSSKAVVNASQDDIEDKKEMVTGEYEPCERREMEGQLYRSLMVNGGYTLEAEAGLVRVHCQPRTDRFLSNGYYEARGYAPGDEEREEPVLIVAMLPGQGLQPHSHDLDEELLVG